MFPIYYRKVYRYMAHYIVSYIYSTDQHDKKRKK